MILAGSDDRRWACDINSDDITCATLFTPATKTFMLKIISVFYYLVYKKTEDYIYIVRKRKKNVRGKKYKGRKEKKSRKEGRKDGRKEEKKQKEIKEEKKEERKK